MHVLELGRALDSLGILNCRNLWIHVGTKLGRAGVSIDRPPKDVLLVVSLSSR